jgi:CheY-like chemotaxis protein
VSTPVPALDLLVVDDDAPTRRYFEIAARGLGLAARACATPTQALELLAGTGVRLLVSDLHLGGANAQDLAVEIARWPEGRRPEFVLMSGGLDAEVRQRFAALGVRRFWPKPIPLDTLRAELTAALPSVAPEGTGMPEAVQAFFQGDRALYERYRAQTLPQLLGDVEQADRAAASQDLQALAGVLHNLKTVLRLVGQPAEAEAAQALETRALAGTVADCTAGWPPLGLRLRALARSGAGHG